MKALALTLALMAPLSGDVSSGFGYRESLGGLTPYRLHDGIDYAAPVGTPVHSASDGYVAEFWPYKNGHPVYGRMIIVRYAGRKDIYLLYAHLSTIYVAKGDFVTRGQVIGLTGNTGLSTGPHLHFQILLDPSALLGSAPPDHVARWSAYFGEYARKAQFNIQED